MNTNDSIDITVLFLTGGSDRKKRAPLDEGPRFRGRGGPRLEGSSSAMNSPGCNDAAIGRKRPCGAPRLLPCPAKPDPDA